MRRIAQHFGGPGIEPGLGLRARCSGPAGRVFARRDRQQTVCERGTGARRRDHVKIGRRRVTARDSVERRAGPNCIAADELMHALRQRQIRYGIKRVVEPLDLRRQLVAKRTGGRQSGRRKPGRRPEIRVIVKFAQQHQSIDHIGRRDRLGRARSRHRRTIKRRHRAQGVDELIEAAIVQRSLEPITQQGAERLPGAHAVHQMQSEPRPVRTEVDRHRGLRSVAMRKISRSQHGGCRRVRQRLERRRSPMRLAVGGCGACQTAPVPIGAKLGGDGSGVDQVKSGDQ